MIEYSEQLKSLTVSVLEKSIDFLSQCFQNLDPSLFQNIILGVLAIFIPFAIGFFTDILNSKKETKSEFEKMVLNDEVLGTKKVFWLAIISIAFFASFSGKDISTSAKIVAIVTVLILIFLFWIPFKKILRFSEGHKYEFEISFLKKLIFSKTFRFKNKTIAEKMMRAWNSLWSEKLELNDRNFTNIFISHIDEAIRYGKFDLAVQLSKTYVRNIEKRDPFSIGNEVLPKVFEWNEIFWNEQQLKIKGYNTEKRIQEIISQKYLPTFRLLVLNIYKKTNSKRERLWNWFYFGGEFFQASIKILIKDVNEPYQLFSSFKKHIEESEKRLDRIDDEKEKEKYQHYITQLFASFCPTFFNEIDSSLSNYGIWEHNFPSEWKISIGNINNRISRIILHEFLQWSRTRIFKKDNNADFDEGLTDIINGIFPNIHSPLFTAFLMLFFTNEVKYALEKEPNFYISGVSVVSRVGSVEENEEDRDKRLTEMMREKEITQKNETIQIILNYFYFWGVIETSKDDLSEDIFNNWRNLADKEKISIINRVKKEKLEKMRVEFESDKIIKICKDSESRELYRKDFLELIKLLTIEIDK